MQVNAQVKLKQITIEVDELLNKGKMTVEGDVIVGGLSLFGSKPFVVRIPINEDFAKYVKAEIQQQIGKIMEDKINNVD